MQKFLNDLSMIFFIYSFFLMILSIFTPSYGGYWMFFLKRKNRLNTIGVNFLVFIFCFFVSGMTTQNDYYQEGKQYLEEKKYIEAIESFQQAEESKFKNKNKFLQQLKNEAKNYYSKKIQNAFNENNFSLAKEYNIFYQKIAGEFFIPPKKIEEQIQKHEKEKIIHIKKEIEKAIQNHQFDIAKEKLNQLSSQLPTEENWIQKMKTQIEEKKKRMEVVQYQKQAKKIRYGELLRHPEKYKGTILKFTGKVFQKISDDQFFVSTRYYPYLGYYNGDTILITYDGKTKIIEEDVIQIYGELKHLYTYQTISQTENTVPYIQAKIVRIIRKR